MVELEYFFEIAEEDFFGGFTLYVDEKGDIVGEVVGVEGVPFDEVFDDFDCVVWGVEVPDDFEEIGEIVIDLNGGEFRLLFQ